MCVLEPTKGVRRSGQRDTAARNTQTRLTSTQTRLTIQTQVVDTADAIKYTRLNTTLEAEDIVCVVFKLNRVFYPTSSEHPVSVLYLESKALVLLFLCTNRTDIAEADTASLCVAGTILVYSIHKKNNVTNEECMTNKITKYRTHTRNTTGTSEITARRPKQYTEYQVS